MKQENLSFGIGGKEVSHFTSIELYQSINNHHKFTIKVPHSVIEKPRAYAIENAQHWLGKTLHIVLGNKNNFLGIITNIQFSQEQDQVGSQIILSGFSKTILLESGKKLHSWEDIDLQEMIKGIIKNATEEKLQNEIVPEYTSKISYQTQYMETDFQYIQRLAKQYNEWLYYDGEKLFFGKPPKKWESINLTFGKDLLALDMTIQAIPIQFSAFTYNDDINQLYQAQTDKTVEGLSKLGNQVLEISHDLYSTASFEYGNLPTGYDMHLEQNLKKRQESTMADANYIIATSRNNKLKIGTIINIDALEEIDINTAHLSGLDVTKNNYRNQGIGQYIITEITHLATDIGEYSNKFKALSASIKKLPEPQITFPQAQMQQAKVVDNADPRGKGRVRVKMLWQQGKLQKTPWLRVMTPDAGSSGLVDSNRGLVFIPEIGDDVIVGFRYNDPNRPFIMGNLFNGQTAAGGKLNNNIKSIYTKSGHRIVFDDTDENGKITIQDQKGNQFHIDSANDTIDIEALSIINLKAKNINLIASENITMSAEKNINMNAKESMFLFGTKQVIVHSDKYVDIESFEDLQLTAKETNLKSTDLLDLTAKKMNIGSQTDLLLSGDEVVLNGVEKIEIKSPDINEVSSTATFPFKERVVEKEIREEMQLKTNK
ncbi:type VI secretion system Vgr family protein [Flavobacterium piscisymbiosum]|uniref:Phage baseplate assembly protein V n=1 Tax=Flavobacterium piscisymbiosum TaxID=2893753 RepID=A0ABS8MF59_9FLAO|nr:phage baseplate assembly protein V [Flavobacterium sp. F-30]MCC9064127.1 phage baseplate assembly protein V [Flavobacterium sp. F-30]